MERRAFLKLLFIGLGAAAAAVPAVAFTSLAPLAEPDCNLDLTPKPAVATSEDENGAQVQKAYYYHPYYRHRRRVYRRHARRVYRRYRRRYYYHPYYRPYYRHRRRVYRRYRRRYYY
jgi:hypothetical protein